ncbi:MAG: OmpA family protein [Phycisphaerales bacterium]
MRNGVLIGRGARLAGLLVAVGAMILGGCGRGAKDYNLVVSENNELRDRNSQLEAALQDATGRAGSLEEENRRLAAGGGSTGGATGFEGIGGVSARRGSRGDIILTVAGDVLFDSGQVSLKSGAKKSLDQVASVIRGQYGTNSISIDGYTDSDPIRKSKWGTNERLSAERALAVEDYLSSKGLSKDQMAVVAYGPANPRKTKQESRRVEIVIVAAAGN